MYKRILVTLDQSELAEKALPDAVAVAEAMDAEVELLCVVPVVNDEAMAAAGTAFDWQAATEEAQQYLDGICIRVQEGGLSCQATVRQGDITEEILRHAEETDCGLIVMSTHGRSGLGRWVYGSIADRVLRYAQVPVLLVRAAENSQ